MKKCTASLLLSGYLLACEASTGSTDALVGPPGSVGPPGPAGPVEPKLSQILPLRAFPSRVLDVQISGVGTHFSSGTTVDFGDPAITVTKVIAGSDVNLVASLNVAAGARLGTHEVTVTSGRECSKLSGVFTIGPSLGIDPVNPAPMLPQGGLFQTNFRNDDYDLNPTFSGWTFNGGMRAASLSAGLLTSMTRMTGMAVVDALASVGGLAVTLSGTDIFGRPLTYQNDPADPFAPRVVARTATTLTEGMALTGQSFPAIGASNLYKITSAANNQILTLRFTSLGSSLQTARAVVAAVAPSSGVFGAGQMADSSSDAANTMHTALAYLPFTGDSYLSIFHRGFVGGVTHTYTLTPTLANGTSDSLAEPGMPDSGGTPVLTIASLNAAVPHYAKDGAIDTQGDQDFIRYTTAANGTVYAQIFTQGVTPGQIQLSIFGNMDCSTTAASSASGYQSAAVQNPALKAVANCLRVSYNGTVTAPVPYRLILVAQ